MSKKRNFEFNNCIYNNNIIFIIDSDYFRINKY